MSESAPPEKTFYYNLETGAVEEGLVSDWNSRMGPYATREEAAKALETARLRNAKWEDEDRAWRDSDDPGARDEQDE
ncbi:SPOR domain-containing protein [Occultella glacieicola]|uniref:SPOR domain-containing protein n=1 Tax=Occultella glacieicola TaxID=2518684 RepID=A0ABY2DZD5_9MICO|nr:SPOR domain-containing protein [Occultella glacieicola]TDE90054.1 SPOR domain-containing protein [Occultella glacieicola]